MPLLGRLEVPISSSRFPGTVMQITQLDRHPSVPNEKGVRLGVALKHSDATG
jgi:hypothetical protein